MTNTAAETLSRDRRHQLNESQVALSISEACKLTSIGRTSIYAAIKVGQLTARKVGRRTVVLRTDLETWLNAQPTVASSADRVASNSTGRSTIPFGNERDDE
jgi:excisionase family DNA binding protein